MHCRRPPILASVAAVSASSLLAAACGGGSPNAGVASVGATTTTAPGAAAVAGGSSASGGGLVVYAGCMRSHGVSSFPDQASVASSVRAAKGRISQISGSEASSPTFQAAQRACAAYAPPTESPQLVSPQELQKLLAVSRCMRAHGIPNFHDPNPTTGELAAPAGIDRSSPQVLAALTACSSLGRAAGLGPPKTGQ